LLLPLLLLLSPPLLPLKQLLTVFAIPCPRSAFTHSTVPPHPPPPRLKHTWQYPTSGLCPAYAVSTALSASWPSGPDSQAWRGKVRGRSSSICTASRQYPSRDVSRGVQASPEPCNGSSKSNSAPRGIFTAHQQNCCLDCYSRSLTVLHCLSQLGSSAHMYDCCHAVAEQMLLQSGTTSASRTACVYTPGTAPKSTPLPVVYVATKGLPDSCLAAAATYSANLHHPPCQPHAFLCPLAVLLLHHRCCCARAQPLQHPHVPHLTAPA
jgi:hypothetical protein